MCKIIENIESKSETPNDTPMNKIRKICDGIEYSRDVPREAKELAKEIGAIIIVGGSDDLMYCYGADCYLTDEVEHGYGWDGDTLENIGDDKLESEAKQLGLKIWWCGAIEDKGLRIPDYDTDVSGAFSYTVNPNIEHLNFRVMEDDDVYCTGIIIKLPDNFKRAL